MLQNTPFKELRIRNCDKSDYSFVYRLTKRNMEDYVRKFWGEWNTKLFRSNFKIENIRIIKYKKKKIGFYDVERKGEYLYIHNLQITRSLQGKGIGKFLMSLIERKAHDQGLSEINLSVFNNSPAKNFYLSLGYQVLNDKKHSSIMTKIIQFDEK